ncbi:BBP7 family outer membrane beta-barrel protein [Crateriforma conspicua]|nr:BBP7 family outer membrane beta-barrel protein [Crateriforma conspicua]
MSIAERIRRRPRGRCMLRRDSLLGEDVTGRTFVAAVAAETFAMQRMTQQKRLNRVAKPKRIRRWLGGGIMAVIAVACFSTATASHPSDPSSEVDFLGSGFASPAGLMMAPGAPSGVMTAGGMQPMGPAGVRQVGLLQGGPGWLNSGCDSCDSMGCQSCAGGPMMGCGMCGGGGCGACGGGMGCGPMGCGPMGGGCGMCGGAGCGACGGGACGPGGLMGNIPRCNTSTWDALRYHLGTFNPAAVVAWMAPYTDGGCCSQRWYDVSVEALFLGRNTSSLGNGGVITRQGAGLGGPAVLTTDNLDGGDLEAGIRISGAWIFGPGGNLELTYMGGQEWGGYAQVNGTDLYSYITDFGTDPPGGLDDVDRSTMQAASSWGDFHSGEFNYRRRTVGPYCRFQGSWLFGLRYLRYDNGLGINTLNASASPNDFFNGSDAVKNNLFGAQIGGDLWWMVMPGVSLGIENKFAWMKNDIDSQLTVSSNSLNNGGAGTQSFARSVDKGTLAYEFQTKLVYRFSHSWSFRSAYYLIAIDDVGRAALDGDYLQNFAVTPIASGVDPGMDIGSVVVQGFSFGTEYIW